MAIDFTVIFYLGEILVNLIVLARIIQAKRKFHYQPLQYFFMSIMALIVHAGVSLTAHLFGDLAFGFFILLGVMEISLIVWSVFLLLLFFDSFFEESPYNQPNIILGSLSLIVLTGSLITGFIIFLLQDTVFAGLSITLNTFNLGPLPHDAGAIMLIYSGFLALGLGLLFTDLVIIARRLTARIQRGKSENTNHYLKKMRHGIIFLVIGSVIVPIMPSVGALVMVFAYLFIFLVFLKGGIFILREENVQRLIIINQSGSAVFYYNFFVTVKEKVNADFDDKNLIFSGALQAVSSLLIELTGNNQVLKEIVLDNTTLLVKPADNHKYSIVLLVDRPTQYHTEALEEFSAKIFDEVGLVDECRVFSKIQTEKANEMIEEYFGL